MELRDCIKRVLNNYAAASQEEFAQHPLANFIRGEFREALVLAAADSDRFKVKGSAGQGVWARGPWIGIFDRLVTNTAQSGYYPVYLFREDMKGVYLSLNQGATEAKKLYKSDAKTALRARAINFRAMLGHQTTGFAEISIDLAPSSSSNDTSLYEAGNICAKYYPSDQLPNDAQLVADFLRMLQIYEALIQTETASDTGGTSEGDEPLEMHYEDATKFRMHKRIERNSGLAKRVKQLQGYTCRVCDTNFELKYGVIGKKFIEAHHLKPLASLKGTKVAMDPKQDFAVLCSNCHRMVHKSGCVDDIAKFKREHYLG